MYLVNEYNHTTNEKVKIKYSKIILLIQQHNREKKPTLGW